MANYNVDIAVALKGAKKLTAFNKDVRTTKLQVEGLNKTLKNLAKDQDLVVKSVSNVNNSLIESKKNFNKVALGTSLASKAAKEYLTALRKTNAALAQQKAAVVSLQNARKSDAFFLAQGAIAGRQNRVNEAASQAQSVAIARANNIRIQAEIANQELLKEVQTRAPRLPAFQERGLERLEDEIKQKKELKILEENANKASKKRLNFQEKQNAELNRQKKLGIGINKNEKLINASFKDRVKFAEKNGKMRREALIRANNLENFEKRVNVQLKKRGLILSSNGKQIIKNNQNRNTRGSGARGAIGGAGINSAIISGVFPLLFGQGPLAALGGATGGFLGGRFGGQMGGFAGGLAGTAIASAIQSGLTAIGELGQAMNVLNPDITKLTEKMGILGTTEQKRLQIIEQTEGKQAALNAALEMMGDKIGDQNVQELKEFGETFRELTNSTVLFFTRVQAAVAKLLNQSLGAIEDFTAPGKTRQFIQENPNAPAFRNINQQIADLEAQRSGAGREDVKRLTDQINALKSQKKEIAETIILEKDKDKIRVNTNKLITAGLADLRKENELNRAIIAGKEEEFLLNQAVEDKVKSMGLEMEKLNDLQFKRIKKDITINQGLKDQADAAQELTEKFEKIGESVEKSIVGNLTDAVMGTQSLGQAAVNVLDSLKRKLIEIQIQKAADSILEGGLGSAIGGFLGRIFKGGKASGGSVAAGSAYLVGEKGPEILQMGSQGGNIIPNDAIREGKTSNLSLGFPNSFKTNFDTSLLDFANGGQPPVNKISVVGERGRELFVPKTAGTIIPNNQTEEILKNQILKDRTNNLFENITKSLVNKINGDTVPETKGAEEFIKNSIGKMFRENGGSVKSGQPYIVGERQPELFVPRTSGTIIPSVPTGEGNTTNNMITVNVDASGSSVQGNGSEADQLGNLIASVVQATIIDEQRAGGLLSK